MIYLRKKLNEETGSALLMVLILVLTTTILGISLLFITFTHHTNVIKQEDRLQTYYAAETGAIQGIEIVKGILMQQSSNDDSDDDDGNGNGNAFGIDNGNGNGYAFGRFKNNNGSDDDTTINYPIEINYPKDFNYEEQITLFDYNNSKLAYKVKVTSDDGTNFQIVARGYYEIDGSIQSESDSNINVAIKAVNASDAGNSDDTNGNNGNHYGWEIGLGHEKNKDNPGHQNHDHDGSDVDEGSSQKQVYVTSWKVN